MWQMVVYNILQYVTRLKLSSLINILCHYLKKPVLSVASFYVCLVLGLLVVVVICDRALTKQSAEFVTPDQGSCD